MANFEISGCKEDAELNPQREWEFITEKKTLEQAKKIAIAESKLEEWHEIEITGTEDGETHHHSYWRNGELEIDMSV